MSKVYVVYWSQTGNTQAMAEAVGEGILGAGKEAVVVEVTQADTSELKQAKALALGCPAMGAEVLEEMDMEPFVTELEGYGAGKTLGLFGSYGWGDGQWMREWTDRMNSSGATVLNGEGILSHETPDEAVLAECRAMGAQLAALV